MANLLYVVYIFNNELELSKYVAHMYMQPATFP